ncbi:MAG TPA: hypothetical protein VGQ59_20835 [Cyclobacteriaceae bacterium]|jgi:hypothetical protein|nr:hypothetical protein [Cyclobacteriaceae bacterium]
MHKRIVELHIEELILHGFPRNERYSIGEAIEADLTRLFTEQGIPQLFSAGGSIPTLNAGTINLNSRPRAVSIGNNIASAVYKGFTDGRSGNAQNEK